MKNRLIVFILLLIGLGSMAPAARASHLAAMDLTLTCIGGNDYIVKFVFYRDCSGVSAPSTVAIAFQCSTNPAYNFTLSSVPLKAGSGQEITQNCNAMPTKCTGGSLYGVREHVFEAQVTLPPCGMWKVYWPGVSTFCCRNPSNTIVSSSSQGGYIEATLNNLQTPCNSTPSFTNKPVTMMCQGQTMCYNHGALDPDGDSLVYSMDTPKNGAGTYVSWIPPYTAQQPLPSNPPITCDPHTGDICMTPTMNIISPMAVKVEQWRQINGVPTLIGTIFRDLQVNVVTCNNQLPVLSGMDTTNANGYSVNDSTYAVELCLGKTISFTIWGHDDDVYNPSTTGTPEKFTLTWNNGIPSGQFQTFYQNTDSAKATFTWTPNITHVSTIPKCFTVMIRDGACPFNGQQTYSYCITVRGMSVNIGSDTTLCKGESVKFTAISDTTTVNYIWKLDGIPTGVPLTDTFYIVNTTNLAPGMHIISIETNDGSTTIACPGVDQAVLTVIPMPKPNLGNDTVLCEPNTLTLDAGAGAQYLWSPTGAMTQTIQVTTTGFYKVLVDGGNGTRCTGEDSIMVEVVQMPIFDLGADTCVKSTFDVHVGLANAYYTWNTGANSEFITPTQSGVYSVTVTNKQGSGCDASDSKVVNIIDFDLGADREICTHEYVVLEAPIAPVGHFYNYIWAPDGQTTSYITVKDKPVGTYLYSVDVGGGCTGQVTIVIKYCPITIPNVFTPNGDGYNDKFIIDGIDNYPGSKIVIYNRWGNRVFESENYSNAEAWTAEKHPDGVYYYVLHVNDGKETINHGSVTVLSSK